MLDPVFLHPCLFKMRKKAFQRSIREPSPLQLQLPIYQHYMKCVLYRKNYLWILRISMCYKSISRVWQALIMHPFSLSQRYAIRAQLWLVDRIQSIEGIRPISQYCCCCCFGLLKECLFIHTHTIWTGLLTYLCVSSSIWKIHCLEVAFFKEIGKRRKKYCGY